MARYSELLLAVSSVWAVGALAFQARAARAGLPGLHAPAAGAASRGILYGFTGAMLPSRKESVSRHPLSFAAGVLLHLGIAASFLSVLASMLVAPAAFPAGGVALAAAAGTGLAAGLFLLAKRFASPDLRTISPPDDYVANLAIGALLASAVAFWSGALPGAALRIVAALVLFYVPLGKLRHAVFFFLARADLSARLGLRGVYPPRGGGDVQRS